MQIKIHKFDNMTIKQIKNLIGDTTKSQRLDKDFFDSDSLSCVTSGQDGFKSLPRFSILPATYDKDIKFKFNYNGCVGNSHSNHKSKLPYAEELITEIKGGKS